MWKFLPTRDIQAKVMWQTHLALMLHSIRLHLSIGEVIDRAILNVSVKTPDLAAVFVCEQFMMATSEMNEEDMEMAFILGIAMLVRPLLQAGMSPDDVWNAVLDVIEELH